MPVPRHRHAYKSLFLEKKSMFPLALKLTLPFSNPLVKGADSRIYDGSALL
jgi:hypothetical protein